MGVERVLVARSNVKRGDLLPLILAGLVIVIGNLKPVPRGKKIEVNGVLAVGLKIEAIEKRAIVPDGMDGENSGVSRKRPDRTALKTTELPSRGEPKAALVSSDTVPNEP